MDALEGDYEVFLSFRGADTRQGFTDILYQYMRMADICVFKDDNELAIGDKIESILGAMDVSKICIPIFSPRFADSKWCLREVTRMVELKKTIVPVFYNVTSDDVKLKTTLYSNDLQKFEDRYGNSEVQKWENALKEAVSNKGRTLGVTLYTEFCKDLVDEVLSKLGPRKRLEIDHFVGDTNKERTMRLLDMRLSSQEVVYVGIYGLGGIGKTTMTMLIHDELLSSFDHCIFLPDIREFSKCNGINVLPKYMYDHVEPKSVAAFSQSRQIPNIFKNKKVLLILDDVDSCEQIKKIAKEPCWFGSGSRVIVTTRDKDVLCDFEKEDEIEMRYVEMEELEKGWSLELFSKCAFNKDSPPSSYQDLSERVVSYAGGLPLAIVVIGKRLRRCRTVEEWEEFIERLDKNPPKEVKDRLLISYEGLEDNEKKIFLDIACLFIGEMYYEYADIFYMWKTCNLYPRLSLEVLQSRSLVKIDKYKYLRMHDQLRDFGRDLVREISGRDVTKQSRLWEVSQVMEVLQCNKKSKEKVEALQFHSQTRYLSIKAEEFISFDNLKYLNFTSPATLQGDFSNLLPELRWLRCSLTVESTNLFPSKLVILDLSVSMIDENWDGWSEIQSLKKLKVLNLSFCKRLGRTPVFGEHMALERLIMTGCLRLTCIDPSIGKLQHLKDLVFSHCISLIKLPNESLGKLHDLRLLNLSWTNITSLLDFSRSLNKVERLYLKGCQSLVHLPQQTGNLNSLVRLDVSNTKISHLPSTIRHLSFLQALYLYRCDQLQELPDLPIGLITLDVKSLVLNKVPNLSHLNDLTDLSIVSDSDVLDWNGSFPSNCKLRTLTVEVLDISRLPGLSNCLELTHLKFKCQNSFEVLPDISSLRNLVSLNIKSCHKLEEIPGIKKLHCLNDLHIRDCPSLKSLENLRELQALTKLKLINCGKLNEIPGLGELRGLTTLKVKYCQSLERLDNLTALKKLKQARLIDCPRLTEILGLGGLPHLDSLHIKSCPSLLILDNLKELQQLRLFKLSGCQRLTEIPELGEMRGLLKLKLKDCDSLETLDCLTLLKNITKLTLVGCQKLTEIPRLGELLCLTSLRIECCSSLLRLESLRELQQLEQFRLFGCKNLLEIPRLDKLRCITSVVLEDRDSFVIFGRNGRTLSSNIAEEVLANIGGEVAVSPIREEAWKKQQSSLTGFSFINFNSNESITSFDGSKSYPICELEGKVVALYFLPSWSLFSCVDFTLDLLEVYEQLKATNSETTFEIVCVTRKDDLRLVKQNSGAIPCLSLCVNKCTRYEELSAYFKVTAFPTVVIIGTDGRVVNFNAVDMIKSPGARAYPFTHDKLEQMVISNEVKETSILWPNKLKHHLHVHQLVLTLRWDCICDCCHQEVETWAYYCKECDFDLHCQCAILNNINTTDQSSILGEEVLQFFKNQTRDTQGSSNKDTQGKLMDLHNLHDPAPCSKHVDLLAEQVTEEVEDSSMFCLKKLYHGLHNHQLVTTERWKYLCKGCNQEGNVWSYCCKQCDFDLCSECGLTNITTTKHISGPQHDISYFGWSCCLPFLSICQS